MSKSAFFGAKGWSTLGGGWLVWGPSYTVRFVPSEKFEIF